MMTTQRQPNGELEPTCRMVPGQSTDSLALEVAAKSGLPSDIVNRAAQLYQVGHLASRTTAYAGCNLAQGVICLPASDADELWCQGLVPSTDISAPGSSDSRNEHAVLASGSHSQQPESNARPPASGRADVNGSSRSYRPFGDRLSTSNSPAPCALPFGLLQCTAYCHLCMQAELRSALLDTSLASHGPPICGTALH